MQAELTYASDSKKKVIPIVPYSVTGRYRNIKTLILSIAYAVYFLLPWFSWHSDRRVGQAILFDLENSRFFFFDLVLFPHDLMIFCAVMVFAATFLFMSATVYGRIFCGFFCFQTIWTDAFRLIEKFVQGEAQARIRLKKQPWSLESICKLTATHVLWLLLSFATALTFTLYFSDAHSLIVRIFSGEAAITAYTAIITITATTYIAAGIAREQICLVACPYGKFQSIMQDPATVTVVYDESRGERDLGRIAPSKSLKNASARQSQGYGDCIDCSYCVNVCPTGVDIREGFQIDCISCGLCIDACDHIMDSVNLSRGLIRFDNTQQKNKESKESNNALRLWSRLKKIGYLSMLIFCVGFVIYSVKTLSPFNATIQQQAQPVIHKNVKWRFKESLYDKNHQ